jgi:uncharacterized protein (TIGR02246 family)
MRNVSAFWLTLALFAVAGCAPRSEPIPEETMAAWEKAYNNGDAAGVAAVYSENGIVMAPNTPVVQGRAAIEKFMQDGMAQGPSMISIKTDESYTHGDDGVRRGTYRVTTKDGQEIEVGKFVELWKKNGDKWELRVDIWNTDAPPPAPAATPAAPAETPAPPPG